MICIFLVPLQNILGSEDPLLAYEILEPTRGTYSNPLHWVEATDDEMYSSIDVLHNFPSYIPYDDPLHLSVQAVAESLDYALRLKYPTRMAVVPKPKIRIMKKSQANAFVSKTLVCVSINAWLKDDFGDKKKLDTSLDKGELILQLSANGRVGVFTNDQVECLDRRDHSVNANDVVNWLRHSLALESCDVTTDGNELYLGRNCELGEHAGLRTNVLAFMATTNRITFMTGLFDLSQNEGDRIFPIFHELAHYYRAHGSLRKSAFQYFYQLDTLAHSLAKPQVEEGFNELGKRLIALPKFPTQAIDGQRYHSELFSYNMYALTSLVRPYCNENDKACFQPCQQLDQLVNDERIKGVLKTFPQAQLGADALIHYFTWEKYITDCYGKIQISHAKSFKSNIEQRPGKLPIQLVRKVYWNGDKTKAKNAQTLLDVFSNMSDHLFSRDAKHNALLKKALDRRLGFYTTEEEADHLATDWMLMQGYSGDQALRHWLNYLVYRMGQMQDSPFNFSAKRCLDYYRSYPKWSEGGIPIDIPIGSFSQSHHNPCFRLWNLDQRINLRVGSGDYVAK